MLIVLLLPVVSMSRGELIYSASNVRHNAIIKFGNNSCIVSVSNLFLFKPTVFTFIFPILNGLHDSGSILFPFAAKNAKVSVFVLAANLTKKLF